MKRHAEDFNVSNGGPLFDGLVVETESPCVATSPGGPTIPIVACPAADCTGDTDPRSRELAAARDRGELGARRAESRAMRIDPAWRTGALAQIKYYAEHHEAFLAEQVGITVPAGADPRALGSLFQAARCAAWIRSDGYAPSKSSNGSAKVLWRSRIYQGGAT